jgi:RDD family/FHA domain
MFTKGLSPFSDGTTTYECLDGCAPATLGRRFGARALDFVLGGAAGLLISLPIRFQTSLDAILTASLVVQVLTAVLTVGVYVYFGITGFLPGGRILGIRQVRVSDGSAPGWSGVAKYLLISLVAGFTFGIGYIITIGMIKNRLNRAWHDTATGLVVLDVKAGRDPIAHPWTRAATRLSAVAPAREAVVSVGSGAADVAPSAARPAVVSAGPVPSAPVASMAGTDVTSLASPFVVTQAATSSSGDRQSHGVPAVVSVGNDGMITGVPWRKREASAPASPDVDRPFIPVREAATPVPVRQQAVEDESDRTMVSLDAIALLQSHHTLLLVGDDGQRIPLDRATVVGRNPVAPDGFSAARLHPLEDPTMSISKTHAVVGPDPDGVWVQDLKSTNGTAVTTANGMRTAVPSGGRLVAGPGAVVHMGKLAFRVTEQ